MTNKYLTGGYRLHIFDRHGSRIETTMHESYSAANIVGLARCKAPPVASYVVTRVIINSLDTAWPWDCKDGEEQCMV